MILLKNDLFDIYFTHFFCNNRYGIFGTPNMELSSRCFYQKINFCDIVLTPFSVTVKLTTTTYYSFPSICNYSYN